MASEIYEGDTDVVLRGPSLHPTAAKRFFIEQPGVRSQRTVQKWDWVLRAVQRRYPEKRVSEFLEEDLLAFLTYGRDAHPRNNDAATIKSNPGHLTRIIHSDTS